MRNFLNLKLFLSTEDQTWMIVGGGPPWPPHSLASARAGAATEGRPTIVLLASVPGRGRGCERLTPRVHVSCRSISPARLRQMKRAGVFQYSANAFASLSRSHSDDSEYTP